MIMARNEDGTYSQVGFVKDNAGIDTEYIYDKDGDIVFEKGFTRETSGTVPLTINGIEKDLKAWSITGNTVQNGTPTPENPVEVQAVGDRTANLFDYSTITTGYRIVWATGNLYKDDTGIMSDFIEVTEGQKYQISDSTKSLTAYIIGYNQNKEYLGAYDSFKGFIKSATNRYSVLTIPKESGCQYIKLMTFISYPINATSMFIEGEAVPNEFIPYGYKIPIVTRGKNLFKAPMYTSKTENGVTWESNGDGTITVSGIASGYSSFMLSNAYPIPSNCIGQNLTFDYRISNVSNIVWDLIIFYDENNTEVGRYASGEKDAVTIKIEPNFKKVTASIKRQDNYKTIGTVGLMIELGTEATPYEPYHEPITTPIYLDKPLYKIGDYADSINYAEQKVERFVKELVLTGTENYFSLAGTNDYGIHTYFIEQTHFVPNNLPCGWCSHFPESKDGYQTSENENFGVLNEYRIYIRVSQNRITTPGELAKWIKNQYNNGTPVKVYYVLATPETETFTAPQIPTLNGTTVIDVDTTVKPTEMYTKYKSSK